MSFVSPNILSRNEVRYWQDQPPDLIVSTQDFNFYRRLSKETGLDFDAKPKKERQLQKGDPMNSFASRPRNNSLGLGSSHMPAQKQSTPYSKYNQENGKAEEGYCDIPPSPRRQPLRLYETRRVLSPTQQLLEDQTVRNRRPWSIVSVEKWLEEQQFFLHLPEIEDVSVPLSPLYPLSATGSNKEIFTWPHRLYTPKECQEMINTPIRPPQVIDTPKIDSSKELLTWPNRRSSKSSKRGRITPEMFQPPHQCHPKYKNTTESNDNNITDYLESLFHDRLEKKKHRNIMTQVPNPLREDIIKNDKDNNSSRRAVTKQESNFDNRKVKNDHIVTHGIYSTDTLSSRKTDTIIDYGSCRPDSRTSDRNFKQHSFDSRQRGSRKSDKRSTELHDNLSQDRSLSSPVSTTNMSPPGSDVIGRAQSPEYCHTRYAKPSEYTSIQYTRDSRTYDIRSSEMHYKVAQDPSLCSHHHDRTHPREDSRAYNTTSSEPHNKLSQEPILFSPRSISSRVSPLSVGLIFDRPQSPEDQNLVSIRQENLPDITADTPRNGDSEGIVGYYVGSRKTPDSGIELDNQGDSVQRSGNEEAATRRLEFRKVKALSWPKYTVTSGVIPEAEKAKVTHVNSTPSSIRSSAIEEETLTTVYAPVRMNTPEKLSDASCNSNQQYSTQIRDYTLEQEGNNSTDQSSSPLHDTNNADNKDSLCIDVTGDVLVDGNPNDKSVLSDPLKNISNKIHQTSCKMKISVQSSTPTLTQPILDNNFVHAQNDEFSKQNIAHSSFSPAAYLASLGGSLDSGESKAGSHRRLGNGLRNLIKLHEKEIERVSGSILPPVSYRRLQNKRSKDGKIYRHSAFGIDSLLKHADQQKIDSKWKRHTTSGFLDMTDTEIKNVIMSEQSGKPENNFDDVDQLPNEIDGRLFENQKPKGLVSPVPSAGFDTVRHHDDNSLKLPLIHKQRPPPISAKPKPKCVRHKSRESDPDPDPKEQINALSDSYHDQLGKFHKTVVDANSQTEFKVITELECTGYENKISDLMMQKEKFDIEREEIIKKLEEQKKIANAYQKLEDRYRKKVHELQKAMIKCTCGACSVINGNRQYPLEGSNTFPRHMKLQEEHEKPQEIATAAKVDGILHELEAWLNTQQSSKTASSTEGSMSVHVNIPSQESLLSSYSDLTGTGTGTGTGPGYDNTLQMLDQFDSTSV